MKQLLVCLALISLVFIGCNKKLKNFDYDISQDGNCIAITVKGCP